MTKLKNTLEETPKARPAGRSARVGVAVKEATLALLAEKGTLGLTLDAVAERAGVNRTTLYRRWSSKPRLITWAMLETMKEQAPPPDQGDLTEDLYFLIQNIHTFLQTPLAGTFFQILAQNAGTDSEVEQAIKNFWDERYRLSLEILDRAIARGELSQDVDREALIEQVFGPFYLRHISLRGDITEDYLRGLIRKAIG